jgi:hypothetical protein
MDLVIQLQIPYYEFHYFFQCQRLGSEPTMMRFVFNFGFLFYSITSSMFEILFQSQHVVITVS